MKRTVAAFLIAPLVPPLLFSKFAFGAVYSEIVIYGGLIGYLAIVLVGAPAYALITTHSRLRARHVLSIAAVVGAVVMPLMSRGFSPQTIGLGALLGLSAGVTFWLIWRRTAA
jgi:hypothetical protein